jgi:hypothetical protein
MFFTTKSLNANAPTPKQVEWFAKRQLQCPATREEASQMIAVEIAKQETAPAPDNVLGAAYMMGVGLGWCGKELPGAGIREAMTQVKILECVQAIQRAMLDDSKTQDDVDSAVKMLMATCMERLAKPMAVERRVVNQMPVAEEAPM